MKQGHAAIAAILALITPTNVGFASTTPASGTSLIDGVDPSYLTKTKSGYVALGDMLFLPNKVGIFSALKNFWPDGTLIYEFDPSITSTQRSAFEAACTAWTVDTPLKCKARAGDQYYVVVRTHTGDQCAGANSSCSPVGRGSPGQSMYIYSGHWSNNYVLQHEIGHAFGFIHEHQRSDRDDYILVHDDNVRSDAKGQFAKIPANNITEYDFSSIMHYDNCTFAANSACRVASTRDLWTMEPRECGKDTIGGSTISTLDKDGARRTYAAAVVAVLGIERGPACGNLEFGPNVVAKSCNGQCAGIAASTQFVKQEDHSKVECGGFLPANWDQGLCVGTGKIQTNLAHDDSDFSCGWLGLQTKHTATATCGCEIKTFNASCTFVPQQRLAEYDKVQPDKMWRSGRIRYFDNIAYELLDSQSIGSDITDKLHTLYYENGADRRFESKMFRLRHKLFSIARWRHASNRGYKLDIPTFMRIVRQSGLRLV